MWKRDDWIKLGLLIVFLAILGAVVSFFTPDNGKALEQSGKYKEAIEVISKSMQADRHKNNASLYVDRARNKRFLNDYAGAHADLDQAKDLIFVKKVSLPFVYASDVTKSFYIELSELYVAEGKHEKAVEDLKAAIQYADKSYYHTQLSWVYEEMKQLDKAEEEINLAVKLSRTEGKGRYDPDPYEVALHERAKFYWRQKRYDEAFKDFDAALAIVNCSSAFYGRGCMYLEKDDAESALKDFDSAISQASSPYDYYYRERGLTYMDLKKYPEALKDFEKTLELNPDNKDAVADKERCLKLMK